MLFVTDAVTACYGGDTLCPQGYKSSQWLCDRCFWGNLTDVRISFILVRVLVIIQKQ